MGANPEKDPCIIWMEGNLKRTQQLVTDLQSVLDEAKKGDLDNCESWYLIKFTDLLNSFTTGGPAYDPDN